MANAQPHPDATRTYPRKFMLWQRRGLSPRASSVLALANVGSIEQIALLGRSFFEGLPNCGEKTLAELAQVAGWPLSRNTVVDAISAALSLSVPDPAECQEIACDIAVSLGRAGFVIAARRTAPVGRR